MTRVEIWMGGLTSPVCVIKNPQRVALIGSDATVLIVAEDGTKFETAPQNVLMITEAEKNEG
jgi:hypothetical protein